VACLALLRVLAAGAGAVRFPRGGCEVCVRAVHTLMHLLTRMHAGSFKACHVQTSSHPLLNECIQARRLHHCMLVAKFTRQACTGLASSTGRLVKCCKV